MKRWRNPYIYIYIRCRATVMEPRRQDPGISRLWFQHVWTVEGWVDPCGSSKIFSRILSGEATDFCAELGPAKGPALRNPEDIYAPNRCPEDLGKLNCWKKVSWSFKLLRSCQNQPTTPRCPRYLGNTWRWQKTIDKTVQVTVAGHRRSSGRRSE